MHLRWQHPGTGDPIQGAMVFAECAQQLLARWLSTPAEAAGLRLVLLEDALIMLGPAEALPWVDGIHYLNASRLAPQLLFPSTVQPTPAPDLIWLALQRRGLSPPVLLWPEPQWCLSLTEALPWADCDAAVLARFAGIPLPDSNSARGAGEAMPPE